MKETTNMVDDFLSQFDNISEYDIPIFERIADTPP